jgi:hypothetical protein
MLWTNYLVVKHKERSGRVRVSYRNRSIQGTIYHKGALLFWQTFLAKSWTVQ